MRRLDKVKRLFILAGWLVAASLLYYLPGNFGFFYMPMIFMVIITIAGVMFVLVNGGIRPIADDEAARIKRHRADEANKTQPDENQSDAPSPEYRRPNPLKLTDEQRIFWSDILLIAAVVPITIVLVDYLLISFNIL